MAIIKMQPVKAGTSYCLKVVLDYVMNPVKTQSSLLISAKDCILREIYHLRSKVEHIHNLEEEYPTCTQKEANDLIDLRARQVKELARNIYQNILKDMSICQHSKTVQSIEYFWSLEDNERVKLWKNRLNITEIK